MSDEPSKALVEREGRPWTGDDHRLQVAAAKEAGLDGDDAEVELYTAGFKAGMTLEDPFDRAIVLRGRTVMKVEQLRRSLDPMLRFLRLGPDQVALRVHEGTFELRVDKQAAEKAAPALESAKIALKLWLGIGLLGLLVYQVFPMAAGIVWGIGLIAGGLTMRAGLVNGRSMLGARLALGLGLLAKEEQLILPPARTERL